MAKKFKKSVLDSMPYLEKYSQREERNSSGKRFKQSVLDSIPHLDGFTRDDDIAPVKEDGLDFFQKSSLFDDGWDRGDVIKTILGTAGDAGVNVLKGAGSLVEGIVDLGAYGVAGVADAVGQDDLADWIRTGAKSSHVDRLAKPVDDYLDKYSVLGRTSEAIMQGVGQVGGIMATGVLGAAGGLSAAGTTALTTGTMFLSGTGSGMGEAYKGGANDLQALKHGLNSGAADAVSELIFGGLGKGINALGFNKGLLAVDDILAKAAGSKLKNQIAKNIVEFGIKSGAEGLEEVLAGVAQAYSKYNTYMKDQGVDFTDVLKDENLLEQFVVGSFTSGLAQGSSFIGNTAKGRDFISGLNQSEQAVVKKEIENRIAEAEKDGKKLTAKEKSEIEEKVASDLERGYISTDLIEEVVGGDTYKAYKDSVDREDALFKEYEELGKETNPNLAQQYRYRELDSRVKSIKDNDLRSKRKEHLEQVVSKQVNGTRLAESYNEKNRVYEDYKPDYSKYEGMKHPEAAKKTIESVIKLGANNTNRVHDFVDMVAKTSADTGLVFTIKSEEQVKTDFIERQSKVIAKLEAIAEPTAEQSKKLADLKTLLEQVESGEVIVNGDFTEEGIVLSLGSKKPLNRLVGHEITHSFEPAKGDKSKGYDNLKKHLFAYAETKGIDIESEINKRKLMYDGVTNADPEAELVADLVGDFLFSDSEYVSKLSVENRNLFQRLYDEVKHLLKLATAGSKEARELERVKRAFEKVYSEPRKQKNTADSGAEHSINRTKTMSWDEQIQGALYNGKNIRRNDTLIVGNPADTSVATEIENKPLAIPLSVLTKASSGKDVSHSIKRGKLTKLDEGIKNAPITIVNPERNAVVYVTDIKQGGLPVIAAFDMNATFDGDEVHKATSIHLQVDVESMLKNLPESATVYVQKNELDPVGATNNLRGLAAKIKFIDANVAQEETDVKYSLVEDQKTIDFLENQDHLTVYKAMVQIDGKLYPPMASEEYVTEETTNKKGEKKTKRVRKLKNPSVLGRWQKSDERPDLVTKMVPPSKRYPDGYGSFDLLKSNGKSVKDVAYNPYEHTSNIVLNDQFAEAYQRPELVTVEYHIPVSELTSGYKAQYAKDSVGLTDWKAGGVAQKLKNSHRDVYLTRWSKPVRIVPDSEVAQKYKEILDKEEGISVPWNVVTPSLREELEKIGVPIDYSDIKAGSTTRSFDAFMRGDYDNGKVGKNAKKSVSAEAQDNVKVLSGGSVTKYSLSTWTPETQTKVSENLTKAGFEKKDVDKWIKDTNSIAAVIASDKARLDFEAADNQVMLKDNQEYIKTLDASTLCAKRLTYQGTFNAIQHRMPNTVLTSDMLIDLLNIMKSHKVQTPCGVCYVESRRRHLGKFAQQWLDSYDGEYKPRLDEVTTSDGLEELRQTHPQAYEDFVAAMSKKGSSNPKVVQLRTEYRNEIMSLTPAQIRKIEAIGGLRVQSFSDFETPHLLDMMQAVMDMSAKGLHSQAYTKVPNFAWVFGDTGIKINLSLIAEGDGFDSDGNLAFSSTEGMDINEAMKLRDAYSKNVGTIIVGANDKHILACMADDRIDYIIPFHRSGWGMRELELMGMDSYTDYTYGQKEHDLNKPAKVVNGVQQYAGLENLYPPDYWNYELSGKENAERYLNLCAKLGREPKFSQFLVNNGDGSYSLQPDGSTDGYWKTLIDFKMYDNDGNGAAQQKVVPNFNMTEAHRVLNEYEGGANKLPVANKVVEEFVAKYSEDIAPVQYSLTRAKELENAYQYNLDNDDMIGAEMAVEQMANLAMPDSKIRGKDGKLIPVYHGTREMFWKFDTSVDGGKNGTAEGYGIYTSDDPEVTEAYGERQIKMYANITKPATSTKRTITASKLAALIKDTCKRQAQKMVADGEHDSVREALFDTWVSNYVYTYDIGMDRAYRETANSILRMDDNDMAIIQEVMAGMGIRDYAEATAFYRDSLIPITGFDGFVTQWENTSIGKKSNIILALDSSQLKSADAVTYDDNGNVIPLSERFNTENDDIRYSALANNAGADVDEGFAPLRSFDILGSDLVRQTAAQDDIAPVAENAPSPEIQMMDEEEEWQSERIASLDDKDAPPVRSIKTVKERLEVKMNNFQKELASNERMREQSRADYNAEIAGLQAEYDAKKNKNTKAANGILRRIERLERMKANVDADYEKRINDLKARTDKVRGELRSGNSPSEQGAMRGELHASIVDGIKSEFAENGMDFDNVLKNAKNLGTFQTVDNTPQRVMEKSLGYKAGQILSDLTVNRVAQNETKGIQWLNKQIETIKQISKEYEIKPGSKESAAAQMYAEGFYVNEQNEIIEYGDKELAADFPDYVKQAQIKGLSRDKRIRKIYDDTLNAINESRARNAYPEIPKLENYFLHFRAMNDTFSRLGLPFNPNDIKAKDLPTDLNGVTADLKPGQPFFASAMHRTGKRTSFDLLGGLEQYLGSAKGQIYHIDDIQTLRALRNYVAETYGQGHGLEGLDLLTEEEAQERIKQVYDAHLSTFAKFLNEEANIIAGKTALIDRGIEGIIGRRGITFLDTVNRQVGANMVGYNVSSSLTNFIAPVQAFAKTNKEAFIKGMAQFAANKVNSLKGKGDGFSENSPVMIRRKGAERFHRTLWQKMSDPGYMLMSAVDDISTELIARAKYNELTANGMDSQQAHIETDKWVSRLMGDRSIGQQPQLYNSKMLGIFTKFQLEVRNQLDSQFYDTIQEAKVSNEEIANRLERNAKTAAKVTSTFVQLAIGQHLFGKLFESVAGYNPAFDIISAIIKAFGWDDDEEDEDTVLDNLEQGFFELMEDMPYYSIFSGGRIPIESAMPIEELIKGKDQYGNDKSRWETIAEAAPYYFMPGGYGQVKKTVAGLGMFSDDHPVAGSYTDSGNLRFPVEDNLVNRAQAAVFGQYASGNARDYFDNERSALKDKQIQEFADVGMSIQDYWDYQDGMKGLSKLEEKIEYIDSLNLTTAQKNILVNNLTDRKDAIDMEDYDQYSSLDEFDYATKNPEKYAFFDEMGITYNTYKNANDDARKAYDWALENPDKYPMSKAIAGDVVDYRRYASDLNELKADKDENGKSISGSRKEKVIDYINSLDIDYGAKLILYKSEYKSDNEANYQIIEYLNSRSDISYEEMVAILSELDFTVTEDGTVYWD